MSLTKGAWSSKSINERVVHTCTVGGTDDADVMTLPTPKTLDTTKEFDGLVSQLGGIKSNMAGSILLSKSVDSGETIDGIVNNRNIKGFVTMSIP